MELTLHRKIKTDISTIGEIFIDGTFECYSLEDCDRNLRQDMPAVEIMNKKIYGKTAIPLGRYEVVNSWSNRFKKYLPLLLNVPGYDGIRLHPGNSEQDSLGCILPGTVYSDNFVGNSRAAFTELYKKLKAVEKKEKIFITIKNGVAL